MRANKKIIAMLLAATTISGNLSVSFAAGNSKSEQTKKQIKEIQAEKNDISKKANVVDKEISSTNNKMDATKNNLEKVLQSKIENEQLLLKTQDELKAGIEGLKQQVATYYMNSYTANTSALETLIKSESVSDYIVTSNHLQSVVEEKDEKVNEVKELLEKQKQIAEKIKKDEQNLVALQDKLSEEMSKLEETKKNYNSKIRELNNKEEHLEDILIIQKEEEERIKQEILAAQRAAQASKTEEKKENTENKSNNTHSNTPTTNTQTNSNRWITPLKSYTAVTSLFGPRTHPVTGKYSNHGGMDIAAPTGTPVYSAKSGTVITSKYSGSYGNYIIVDHGNGIATLYAHLSARLVSVGTKVSSGQLIGKVGSTGRSTGPHLHLEIRKNGERTDPQNYVSF